MTAPRGGRDRLIGCGVAAATLAGLLGLQALPGAASVPPGEATAVLLPPPDGTRVPSVPGYRYLGRLEPTGETTVQLPVQPGAEVAVLARCARGPATPVEGAGPGSDSSAWVRLSGAGDRTIACASTVPAPVGAAPGVRSDDELPLDAGDPVGLTPALLAVTPPRGRQAVLDVYERLDDGEGLDARPLGARPPWPQDAADAVRTILPSTRDMNGVHRFTVPTGSRLCWSLSTPGTVTILAGDRAVDIGETAAGWPSPSGVDGLLTEQVSAPMAACRDTSELRLSTALPGERPSREITVITEHFADPGWVVWVASGR